MQEVGGEVEGANGGAAAPDLDLEDTLAEQAEEEQKLGGLPPWKAILWLSLGPLISEVCFSVYGLMDSFWISKSHLHRDGLEVAGLATLIDFLEVGIAEFFSSAMSSRISYLFGRQKKAITAQVTVDLIRYALLAGVVLPAVVLPIGKPLMRFYGASEALLPQCWSFIVPAALFGFVDFVFLSLCGLIEAMGHPVMYAVVNASFCALNVFVFDPIFLMIFKTDMWGVAAATYLAEVVPMVFIFVALFNHKFSVKPTLGMFFRKPNKHSLKALKVSVGQLIAQLMTTLPALFIMKLIELGADEATYGNAIASWNVYQRLYQFCAAICLGINQGYLPAASFAVGRKDSVRVGKLTAVAALLGSGWTILCMIAIEPGAEFVARLFASDAPPEFVPMCAKMLRYGFAMIATVQFQVLLTAVLQALKLVCLSLSTSVGIFMIPVPVFGLIMFLLLSKEPTNLMLVYAAKDVWALGWMAVVVLWKLRWIFPAMCKKSGDDVEGGLMEELDPEIVNRI